MSVDYDPIIAVGKWFESEEIARNFLQSEKFSKDLDDDLDDDLEEALFERGMCGGVINAYNGYGYYIGYDLDTEDIVESYKESVEKWNSIFKSAPEVVNTVRVS